MKLEFDWRCTCSACPEQYYICLFGRSVAYFRLRWGHISVMEYDEKGSIGNEIFGMNYGDCLCGEIDIKDEKNIKRRIEQEIVKHWLKQTDKQI